MKITSWHFTEYKVRFSVPLLKQVTGNSANIFLLKVSFTIKCLDLKVINANLFKTECSVNHFSIDLAKIVFFFKLPPFQLNSV